MKNQFTFIKTSALLLSVALLPGCNNPFGGGKTAKKKSKITPSPVTKTAQNSTGKVLCSINGEAVIRESDLQSSVNQMLQSNPYFKGAGAQSIPLSIKKKLFDELVKQELIVADAGSRNIYKDPEFVKDYEKMITLVKRTLAIQFFQKRIFSKIDVSDDEISKHYDENKSKFVKVAGGSLVMGVKFTSEDAAFDFLDKAKVAPKAFEALAKKADKGILKNFGRVNKQPAGFGVALVPAPIRQAALDAREFPFVDKVKVGKDHWVISAQDKKETSYFALDEIKSQVSEMIKNNRFRKELDSEISQLRGTMTVNINDDYFQATRKELSKGTFDKNSPKVADAKKSDTKAKRNISTAA